MYYRLFLTKGDDLRLGARQDIDPNAALSSCADEDCGDELLWCGLAVHPGPLR